MKNIIENKRIFVLYIISVTIIYLCVCFAVNICKRNYIQEIKPLLSYGLIFYAILLINYFWYISVTRKKFLLKKRINKINSKINYAVKLLKTYIESQSQNYRKYNHIRRKVNKILSRKKMRETFEPFFEEDEDVLKVIKLFDLLSEKGIKLQYQKYKELFKKQNGLQALSKLPNSATNIECSCAAKNYMVLLKGTVDNNNEEIKKICNEEVRETLYKKYNVFQKRETEKKLIKKCVVLTILLVMLVTGNIIKDYKVKMPLYNSVIELIEQKDYDEAYLKLIQLNGFKDSEEHTYNLAKYYIKNDNSIKAFGLLQKIAYYKDSQKLIEELRGQLKYPITVENSTKIDDSTRNKWKDVIEVSEGRYHVIGLKKDGKVVSSGSNTFNRCDVGALKDVITISAGQNHNVGLKENGTVVADGYNDYGQCNTHNISDITMIAAGANHTLCLKENGSVAAIGANHQGQCGIDGRGTFVAIYAGARFSIGLRSNGTLDAFGENDKGQCNVDKWNDILSVAVGDEHTVGLKKDGTVVAIGRNREGQCEVEEWKDIVAIYANGNTTIGLKLDGEVLKAKRK